MSVLTQEELELIRKLRNGLGVLESIEKHLIPNHAAKGTILVACADGDRIDDTFSHHKGCHEHGRHHLISAAGGPIAGMWGEGDYLAREIDIARRFKTIDAIVLTAHAPCAMARAENMSIIDIIDTLFVRKEWLKRIFKVYAETKGGVACHLHVDNGEKKRTYHVNKEAWLACKYSLKS